MAVKWIYDEMGRLLKTEARKNGALVTGEELTVSYKDGVKNEEVRKRKLNGTFVADLVTRYEYNLRGQPTRVTYPDDKFSSTEYDPAGHAVKSVDRAGRVTERTYDGAGRVEQTTLPDKTYTFTYYDAAGQVERVQDRRGKVTAFDNTIPGRRKTIFPPLADGTQQTSESFYDGAGNLKESKDTLGNRAIYGIDGLNRVTSTTFTPVSGSSVVQSQVQYEAPIPNGADFAEVVAGRIETDADEKKTFFGMDGVGRLKVVTLGYQVDGQNNLTGDAATTVYTYDQAGNLVQQKDGEGRITSFEYDSFGRRTKRTLPLVSGESSAPFESYEYYSTGELSKKTDFENRVTQYDYDPLGRLAKKTFGAMANGAFVPSSSVLPTEFKYNSLGQRLSMKYSVGGPTPEEVTYRYRDHERLWKKIAPQGTIEYDYDENGNVKKIAAGTHLVTYDRDARGRLDKVWAGGVATSYKYDALGNLQEMLYPNALKTVYGYNNRSQLTDVTVTQNGSARASFNYNPSDHPLPASGMRNGSRDIVNGISRNVDYYYDAVWRLTKETIGPVGNPTASLTYDTAAGYDESPAGFDKAGNRRSRTITGTGLPPAQTFTYNTRDALNGDTIDKNGNTTLSGGISYGYDDENHLTTAGTATFVYDGDGRRIRKTTSGVTTHYLVDDLNPTGYPQSLLEKQGADPATASVTKTYVWGTRLISQTLSGNTHYQLVDGHGNTRALVNDTTITDTYDFDAFGNKLTSSTGTTDNNYLYCGEQFDSTLGMYLLGPRYYRPQTGRFLTRDSFEGSPNDPRSLNLFNYCAADPVNNVDPTGMFTQQLGYLAEDAIQEIYARDHPADAVDNGRWTRFGGPGNRAFRLKPDILNHSTKRWAEIKPFSYSGITKGAAQYLLYAGAFAPFDYYPDVGWKPSTHFTEAGTVPIFFFNAGGVIFYTDALDMAEDGAALATVQLARQYFLKNSARLAGRTLLPALTRISGLAISGRAADGARFQMHVGIAGLLSTLGGL